MYIRRAALALLLLYPIAATAKVYRDGGYAIDVDMTHCGSRAALDSTFTVPTGFISPESAWEAQDAVDRIMARIVADCPGTTVLSYWILSGNQRQRGGIRARDDWQLRAVKDAERQGAMSRVQAAQAFTREVLSAPANDGHALRAYGYASARLVGQAPGVALYVATKTARARSLEFVALHDSADGQAMFETLPPDDQQAIRPAPSWYAQLKALIGDTPVVQQRVLHHLRGYHHPKDDRLKVLGPHYSETPLLTTQFNPTWRRGVLQVAEHDRYPGIGFDTERQRPPVTLAAAQARFGPSAPADGSAAEDDLGPLPPEGPSQDYLAGQRELRQRALAQGFLYRNDAFWAQFRGADVRAAFEAHSRSVRPGQDTRAALMRYLSRLSKDCPAQIDDPRRFEFKEVITETDEWGNRSSRTNVIWDLVVPGRFEPVLERHFNPEAPDAGQVADAVVAMLQPGGLAEQARDLKALRALTETAQADVDRLFAIGGCADPHVQQLGEMLYRIHAPDAPTASPLAAATVQQRSDDLYRPGTAPDLRTACLANSDFPTEQQRIDWCACTSRVVARNAPDRVDGYTRRHRQLQRDAQVARTAFERGQMDHPGIAVFGNMRSSCVRR